MDAVVDLGQRPLEVPIELKAVVFLVFETLEFLDKVELEFNRNPRGELEGNVFVGVGAAVAASAGNDANGSRFLDPVLWRENETVQSGLNSNSVEFDGIKIWVVEFFPDAEELDSVAIAQPVANEIVTALRVLEPSDVGEADEVLPILRNNRDGGSLNFNGDSFGFTHGIGLLVEMVPIPSNSMELEFAQDCKPLEFERFNCGEFAII